VTCDHYFVLKNNEVHLIPLLFVSYLVVLVLFGNVHIVFGTILRCSVHFLMYLCMYVCMWMCVCMYLHFIYLELGTVNNSPLQLGAFSLVQFTSLFCMSSKSIDSIKALNSFQYLDMSSCLLSGQFLCLLIWCFRSSCCVLVLVQWNRRWSMVWSPWPHEHLASSRRFKRWR